MVVASCPKQYCIESIFQSYRKVNSVSFVRDARTYIEELSSFLGERPEIPSQFDRIARYSSIYIVSLVYSFV